MRDSSMLRVRRRAVGSYTARQAGKRRQRMWLVPVVALLAVGAILGLGAMAVRNANLPNAILDYQSPDAITGTEMDRASMTQSQFMASGYDDVNSSGIQAQTSSPETNAQSWDRMIIRTANVGLTVKDVRAAVDRASSLAVQHGGYVFSTDSSQQGDYTYATLTIYVPSKEFDQVMPALRNMEGLVEKVTSETVTSSDVTEEYTDLQSQLRNSQATEARMLELQAKASALEDVLAVDRELRTVQGEIEKIQGRLNYLDKRTEMSTITMQFGPVAAPAPQTKGAWQPEEAASTAWDSSLYMLGKAGTALIMVGVFLWWAVPIGLVAVWMLTRGRKRQAVVSER